MNEVITREKLLFEEDVHLTDVKEFGFSWQAFAAKSAAIPSQGLRFDIYFKGEVKGDRLKGTIEGVDYLTVRSDGRLFLTLKATITTDDGAAIAVSESGINDNGILRLNMDFHTHDSRYTWLNQKHVWGAGTVDFNTGTVIIKGYEQ